VDPDPHHFDSDPDPPFHFDAHPDPDPTFHSDVDPDPDPDPFNLMGIRLPPFTFFPDLDPPMRQNGPLRLRPFHFDADPHPAFHFDPDPDPAFHFHADLDPASQNDPDPQHSYKHITDLER
jgi:hypothetical protein